MQLPDGRVERRCRRFNTPRHAHALTFSCHRRLRLLTDDACLYLAEAIVAARERHHFALWAYVFMPEHVHLLLYPAEHEYSVSAILKAMKQPAARRALRDIRRSSPQLAEQLQVRWPDGRTSFRFWAQGGGYDRNVTDPVLLSNIIAYIEANPVRKGLSKDPGEWRWSSAASRNDVNHILPCDPVRI